MTRTIEINNPEKDFKVTVVANIEFLDSDITVARQLMDAIHRVYTISYNDIEINTNDIKSVVVYWQNDIAFADIRTSNANYAHCSVFNIQCIG